MYIVAIAWLYVALMMAITEKSVTAGVLTLVFYGIAPCALLLWLFGAPTRRRHRLAKQRQSTQSVHVAEQAVDQPDGDNARADQHELKH